MQICTRSNDVLKLTRSKFIREFSLGLGATWVLAACGQTKTTNSEQPGSSARTLTVATEPAFPPFESQGETGELEGFDIDVVNAIAQAADFSVKYDSLPFDGIIPALQSGTIDAAVSAITITKERSETVDFSRPYFKAGLAIAVAENNTEIQGWENLKGKKIAVQIGTTGAQKAETLPDAKITTFDSAPLALQELANGNVDAVINDAPVTLAAIASGNIKGLKVVGQLLTEEFYGIALPKNSPNLTLINQGLSKILEDGTYAQLYQKWFGTAPPELPESAF
jgi:arginine/lysine/histidine/glutamine transport system substrate-binding/permease protein